MIHPDTELRFISDVIGYGLVAKRLIPRGTITWVRDDFDQAYTPQQVRAMDRTYRDIMTKYSFIDSHGNQVLCWDLARFVNHSCEPTCLSAGYDMEIAVRDIQAGEELTDDYGTLDIACSFDCRCEKPGCRGTVRPDDLARLAGGWDALVRKTFPIIEAVEQPLWEMVKHKDEVQRMLRNPGQINSCWASSDGSSRAVDELEEAGAGR